MQFRFSLRLPLQRRLPSMTNKALFICLALLLPISNVQAQYRTLTDKEAASWFETPEALPGPSWAPSARPLPRWPADPSPGDYGPLRQVLSGRRWSAGRLPLLQTAGPMQAQQVSVSDSLRFSSPQPVPRKSRPVYWGWSLAVVNGPPTAPSSQWQYAVNVGDTRFIHFWINQYIEPMSAPVIRHGQAPGPARTCGSKWISAHLNRQLVRECSMTTGNHVAQAYPGTRPSRPIKRNMKPGSRHFSAR